MGKKLTGAIVTVAAVGIIGAVAGGSGGTDEETTGLYPPKKSSSCDGMHYEELVDDFTDAGFTNFEYTVIDDLVFGWFTDDGEVEDVTINGDTDFTTDTLYPPDAVVNISYHTFPSDDEETTAESSSGVSVYIDVGTSPITETTAPATDPPAPQTQPTEPETEAPKPTTQPPAVTEPPKPVTTPPPVVTEAPEPVTQPPVVTQAPAAQTLKILSVTSPVIGGNNATLTAKGKPGTEYDIRVVYSSGESSAEGLENKTAAADGTVSWTWKVGSRTKPGTYTITVKGGGETDTITITITE